MSKHIIEFKYWQNQSKKCWNIQEIIIVIQHLVEPAIQVIHNFQDSVPLTEEATMQRSEFAYLL